MNYCGFSVHGPLMDVGVMTLSLQMRRPRLRQSVTTQLINGIAGAPTKHCQTPTWALLASPPKSWV